MKKIYQLLFIFITFIIPVALSANIELINQKLDKYKELLEKGTYDSHDWSFFIIKPKSRYHTFKKAFNLLYENKGKVIVELGTTRSFVHGGLIGCNSDDPIYWTPNNPENWDWGAGSFTRVFSESFSHLKPEFHTVDLCKDHINRCKIITNNFREFTHYHVISSINFLKSFDKKIDLLYLDTGDIWPIEPSAQLQLSEAKIIVARDLITKGGLILIDDVRHPTPMKFGEKSSLGKSKYSLPYLLQNGFEVIEDEFQVLLKKIR